MNHTLQQHLSRAAGLTAALLVCHSVAGAQQPIQPRMGAPLPGLTPAQLDRFAQGNTAFNHILSPTEGLGPIFNDTSCQHCHLSPMPGGSSTKFVTRFGVAATGSTPFDPLANLGGSLLQAQSVNTPTCDEVVPTQANVQITRITPGIFGFGLVEAIDDADILVNEAFPPPGVSGRAQTVQPFENPIGQTRVGRFGWKAQVGTLLTFSADAGQNEVGLSNRFVQHDNAPNGNMALLQQCDQALDPEDHPDVQGYDMIDRWNDFQRFLAPPPQTPRSGMTGEQLFTNIGCAACHLTSTFTASPTGENGIANQVMKPYSDFLVHDVGLNLGDGIPQGIATETEFRTTPLWGVGHRARFGLLHDLRVSGNPPETNIHLAILAHEGECQTSRDNYVQTLTPAQQLLVQKFLMSLGHAEFDIEYNNNVDEFDWFFLRPMLTGPGASFTADDPQAIADFDQDGDFDLRDIGALQRAFTGT
jgi:CxxC motif-containing protein (DUF1111 family)